MEVAAAGKAQAGLEYLIITGILLAFLTTAVIYIQAQSADTIRTTQAKDAVREIAAGADRAAALGPGTKTFVFVTLPDGMVSASVSSHEISIRLALSVAETDTFETTDANMIGALPLQSGVQKVKIEVLPSGVVQITGNITE